ncbi:phosphoribosylanthranilate isomerase [Chryseosolibacter indicus]|uniref:N-(5'-phosphoribosyl)anthranilate isomerase n=1 Tax=Chryseosolibacter indicus TaxID=2782351 RepID=A0ABS5VP89_9BACT|nr:phosphoribosylanthranilate isomerase [Chryseosolibacter indicus]MBT1703255.1 phosphoribosylanthranilate isomerase [Chryseosolibacter indicus]
MTAKAKIKLKVCGMRLADNIIDVSTFMPDYMGFIFFEDSPRFVGEKFLLPEELPATIERVGVFVNKSTERIMNLLNGTGITTVQLHGSETVEQCLELRQNGLEIIKTFSIDDDFNFEDTKPYVDAVDFFLFDTKGKYYGGNAKTFNWNILTRYHQQVPFFLSGGLNEDNIKDALLLKDMNLYALDVNSGVEHQAGLKDLNKIRAIINILKTNS